MNQSACRGVVIAASFKKDLFIYTHVCTLFESIYLFISLFICFSIYLSTYLPFHVPMYVYVYLCMDICEYIIPKFFDTNDC